MKAKLIEIQKFGSAWAIIEFNAASKRITNDREKWQHTGSVDEAIQKARTRYGSSVPILVRGPAGCISKIINQP